MDCEIFIYYGNRFPLRSYFFHILINDFELQEK